ncbi:cache domain-containing protein [Kallotenue papyrolyticum]|uniref:cache domain-containing protein n=1 Tax=Kallotenue papyrolyticum TaxID=1325125 RepID=UPI0004785A0E|nr:cache domain-containing protein [Kallotenue papyrolyticum]
MLKIRERQQKRRQRSFWSISNQLRYGIVLLVVLAVALTGAVATRIGMHNQSAQIERTLNAQSTAAATQLAAYTEDLQGRLRYLSRISGLVELPATAQERMLQGLIRQNEAYELAALVDADGRVLAAVAPAGVDIPTTMRDTAAFESSARRGEDFVGPVEQTLAADGTRFPTVMLAVPVRDQQDQIAGALIARVNLRFLWFIVSEVDVGAGGYAYIVDTRNMVIARTGAQMETFEPEPLDRHPDVQQVLYDQAPANAPYTGLLGQRVLGVHRFVPGLSWYIVVELPVSTAYAPIRAMTVSMGGVLAAIVLVAGLVGWFMARRIVQPLKRLTDAALALSGGDLDTRVDLPRRDELGILATTFNNMAARLRTVVDDLRREQRFVNNVMDSTGALMLVLDEQGRVLRLNRACSQVLGHTTEQVAGRPAWELLADPQEAERLRGMLDQLRAGQTAVEDESVWVMPDGRQRVIAWSYRVLQAEHDQQVYIICSGIDVTDVREAEKARARMQEEIIRAQAEILTELSTPLIPLTDEVVFMPLIGAIDAQRAQQMLSVLLQGIEQRRAQVAIIDITGVPTVDTQVAAILVQAVQAARLLGATAIISGINPGIASTLTHLGVNFRDMVTISTLHQGLELALSQARQRSRRVALAG